MKKGKPKDSARRIAHPLLMVSNLDAFVSTGSDLFEWRLRQNAFLFRAAMHPILEALIYRHNHPPTRKRLSRSNTPEQYSSIYHPAIAPQASQGALDQFRFAETALRYLIQAEGATDGDLISDPASIVATATLAMHPFSGITARIENETGALFFLFCAAQHLRLMSGCTIEKAILICMTESPKLTVLPDSLTHEAALYVIKAHKIPLRARAISERFKAMTKKDRLLKLRYPGAEDRFPGLDWSEVRRELATQFAREVRETIIQKYLDDRSLYADLPMLDRERVIRREYDPGDKLEKASRDDLPRFLRNPAECEKRLTKVALAIARAQLALPKAPAGYAEPIRWHKYTFFPGLGAAFDAGYLQVSPLA